MHASYDSIADCRIVPTSSWCCASWHHAHVRQVLFVPSILQAMTGNSLSRHLRIALAVVIWYPRQDFFFVEAEQFLIGYDAPASGWIDVCIVVVEYFVVLGVHSLCQHGENQSSSTIAASEHLHGPAVKSALVTNAAEQCHHQQNSMNALLCLSHLRGHNRFATL